jgi:hypothetical protein
MKLFDSIRVKLGFKKNENGNKNFKFKNDSGNCVVIGDNCASNVNCGGIQIADKNSKINDKETSKYE